MTQATANAAWQARSDFTLGIALNISEELIDEGMDILEDCFKAVL